MRTNRVKIGTGWRWPPSSVDDLTVLARLRRIHLCADMWPFVRSMVLCACTPETIGSHGITLTRRQPTLNDDERRLLATTCSRCLLPRREALRALCSLDGCPRQQLLRTQIEQEMSTIVYACVQLVDECLLNTATDADERAFYCLLCVHGARTRMQTLVQKGRLLSLSM
jgi:hypothetical protein